MPDVDLTEMDLAVIRCLHGFGASGSGGVTPPELVPCLNESFPGYDEVSMREGESITRLRGRRLILVAPDGRVSLTAAGQELAEGLQIDGEAR